ncbi:MAG: hypothetical protein AAF628_20015 [Planctomycetota bacterium]
MPRSASWCCLSGRPRSRGGIPVVGLILAATVATSGAGNAQARVDPLLRLQYATFDPLDGPVAVPGQLRAHRDASLHIVQLTARPEPEHRRRLIAAGADLTRHSYLPPQSFLVRLAPRHVAAVRALPFVRWIGQSHPAYRMEPQIVADLASGAALDASRYHVLLFDQHGDEAGLERRIERMGGVVEERALRGGLIRARLSHGQLLQVAHDDAVLWLDRWTPPGKDMHNALRQAGVVQLHSLPIPIDGKGMTGHLYEGQDPTHPEFAALPPYRTTPQVLEAPGTPLSTYTGGPVFARGVHPTNPAFRGSLPFGQMWYTGLGASNRYSLYQQIMDPAGPVRGTSSVASWGGGRTTSYTATSAATDTAIFDHDIYVSQSQSNAGARPSRPEAWAKNISSVGAFLHRNNSNPSDDCWCRTGSIGPAADGRIGVTVTCFYDNVLTTGPGGGYQQVGGTSVSAPMCHGFGKLMQQMHTEGITGYPSAPSWRDRFDYRPHFTTTKAMVMATTRQLRYNASGTSQGANRFQQGWGFPHPGDLYAERDRLLVIDEEAATVIGPSRDVLAHGESRTYVVFVRPGTPEFRAALTYADLAGNPATQSQHRVNDLDLDVLAPDGTRYPGNSGLTTAPSSAPGTVNDDKNTEEMVFLRTPPPGAYTVTVTAREIVADTHVETAAIDADYALAVRGIGGGRDASGMVFDLMSSGPGDLRVSVSNVPDSGWSFGYTFLSADTSRHLGIGNGFGLEFDALAASSAAFAPVPGGLFAFTDGGAALYPRAQLTLPPAVALALRGVTLDGVVVLLDAAGAVVDASNVDRLTVN